MGCDLKCCEDMIIVSTVTNESETIQIVKSKEIDLFLAPNAIR